MSRYPWEWHKPAPKKAPPAHGIKVKATGATWWGRRWIEALEGVLGGDAARLGRGRTYARAGRVHDLIVKDGRITAKVTGSRARPYEITIELPQLDDSKWRKAISSMAAKAQYSAELLAGHMPREIDTVFRAAGTTLFPARRQDLVTSCSCPDWGDPCKHVAATHYVLGEALDRDPFLLFELRGRTQEQVLEALRAARGADAGGARKRARTASQRGADPVAEPETPKVTLGKLAQADYDALRAPLPSLRFSFDESAAHGAVLKQLGAPAAWNREDSPAEFLQPLVQAAAATARRIAMAEPGEAPLLPEPAGDPETVRGNDRTRVPRAPRAARSPVAQRDAITAGAAVEQHFVRLALAMGLARAQFLLDSAKAGARGLLRPPRR